MFIKNHDDLIVGPFQTAMKNASEIFATQFCFFLLNKKPEEFEAFVFGVPPTLPNIHTLLANEVPLLTLFTTHFCEKFKKMKKDMALNLFDIATPMGPSFYEKVDFVPASVLKKRQHLLKQLGIASACSLTKRELEIIPFYLKGYSASQIAKRLFISSRTVEHHIENLKNKFGCSTKRELIEKLIEFQAMMNALYAF